MIKMLSLGAAVLAGAGLVAAAPASAAGAAPPAGTGYAALAPSAFHSARVTLRVPAVTCSKSGPDRGVQLGLFVTVPTGKNVKPVSLTVDAICHAGSSTYRAVYRQSGNGSPSRVRAGDRIRLILHGKDASSFEVDDLTTGAGEGGGSAEGPGPTPHADRHVLIGARVVGKQPRGVQAGFTGAAVDGTALTSVSHHRQGQTTTRRVGALHRGNFVVTLTGPTVR